MKYERFKQLWDALVTDRAVDENSKPVAHIAISQHTTDALVALSHGDRSHFDAIQHHFKKMKSTLKCKTPAKAQINFRKKQRIEMNRTNRREGKRGLQD